MNDINSVRKFAEISELDDWKHWAENIPEIHFKPEWGVCVIPPFGGAVARFRVKYKCASVSVYLDCFDRLGCYGSPYWELYPYDDDVYRVDIDEAEELVERIEESIAQQIKENTK